MRFRRGIVPLTLFLALAGPALAVSERDKTDCAEGNLDRQIAGCSRIIQDRSATARERFVSFYNRGNAYRDKFDYDRALADYSEAIRLDPKQAFAHNNRGIVHRMKGNFESAIADFAKRSSSTPSTRARSATAAGRSPSSAAIFPRRSPIATSRCGSTRATTTPGTAAGSPT
jgi:tetratricopeptide (TPR) repeat protein